MAGAGYKLFNTGDVLTAAQVNTYLQEQAVMRFANAAARTTALSGVLAEGMMSYLDDTNSVEVYNGSAWVSVGSTGDITGVTAGTGISGGGTSGDVTITNSMATAIDAKGDLIVGTGADTFSRLAVGTNGHTLVADSSTATGLKWAAGGSTFVGCKVFNSANFDLANNTYVLVTFNSESFDSDGFHSTTTNTSRLTIPSGKDGKYRISFYGNLAGMTADDSLVSRIYKNGSGQELFVVQTAFGSDSGAHISVVHSAVAGDYFEIYVNQNSGVTKYIDGGSTYNWFTIEYLGA